MIGCNNKEPALQSMSNYFSGLKIEYDKASFVNENNKTVDFIKLLDQQIHIFAQDLIYRLVYVYGGTYWTDNEIKYTLKNPDETDCVYDGKQAVFSSFKIVTAQKLIPHENDDEFMEEINIKNPIELQTALNKKSSVICSPESLMFVGAMKGAYTRLENNLLQERYNDSYDWAMYANYNFNSDPVIFHRELSKKLMENYLNDLKCYIASILADKPLSNMGYNSLLTIIPKTGITMEHKDKIVEAIKNKLIGKSRVATDDEIYIRYYKNKNILRFEEIKELTTSDPFYPPRCYKAYSIIIPAIVEAAINNTYEGTSISLYPVYYRRTIENINNVDGLSEYINYKTITLKPKADTPTTRLFISIACNNTSNLFSYYLDIEINIGGNIVSDRITLSFSPDPTEYEINLQRMVGSVLFFGEYNGSSLDSTPFEPLDSAHSYNGDNYIKLTITDSNQYADYGYVIKFLDLIINKNINEYK